MTQAELDRSAPLFENLALPVSASPALSTILPRRPSGSELVMTLRVLSFNTVRPSTTYSGSGVVRVEMVLGGETADPLLLYLVDITPDLFTALKEEQALRVDLDGFCNNLVQLFTRAAHNELKVSLRNSIQEENALILSVMETTAFRDVSHLTIRLSFASDDQKKQFLYERLKQELKRNDAMRATVANAESQVEAKQDEVRSIQAHLEAAKMQIQAERVEFHERFDRRHAEALREARLEVGEEERERRSRDAARIAELEASVRTLEEEVRRARTAKAEAEAEAMRRSGANDALGPLRAEANELRSRSRELETRAFEEGARAARLQEHVQSLEREMQLKDEAASRTQEVLRIERERVAKLSDELDLTKARLREAESIVKAKDNEDRTLESDLSKARDEIETLRSKIRTKNSVIKEQERVVGDLERDMQRFKAQVGDLEREVSIERTKSTELRTKLEELKRHLEESAKMLEANSNVITYLNRELNNATVGATLTYGSYRDDFMFPKEEARAIPSSKSVSFSNVTSGSRFQESPPI